MRKYFYELFDFHNCITNGACEKDGHYIPIDDLLEGNINSNRKKYFRSGDDFPEGDWIEVPGDL